LESPGGDKSDNIPGVNGFGKKAAEELLTQYGSIENLIDHLSELPARRREALEPYREQAVQSKRLATIVRDVPETLDLQHCAWHDVDRTELIRLFRDLEFRSLIDRIQGMILVARKRRVVGRRLLPAHNS
jgi:DNA polymerase-1